MRNTLILVSSSVLCLSLASCNGGAAPVDSKQFLTTMEGPKVTGVNEAMLQAASQAEAQGNFKLAAQHYEQVLEKQPEDVAVLMLLADSYRRDGQAAKAIAVYDAALAIDEKNIFAKEGKSLALIASGDFDTPAVLLDEVMQVDATRWKTLNALGILFTTRNMQPEAQQYFNEALKHHADSASILNNLGLSQALERNFDGSVATLTRASTFAATGSLERKRIDLNNALVLASAGKVEDAKHIAEIYLSGAELDNNLGLYAHLAKDDKIAKAYLNKALSDSKVYYPKAWENLEDLNKGSSAPTAEVKPEKKAAVEKKVATVKAEKKPATKAVVAQKPVAKEPEAKEPEVQAIVSPAPDIDPSSSAAQIAAILAPSAGDAEVAPLAPATAPAPAEVAQSTPDADVSDAPLAPRKRGGRRANNH